MNVIECIRERRSIRNYSDKPVEWDKVVKIIEAARLAPSSGNIQNWGFVIVKEYANRKKIVEACFDQEWVGDAPVLIVICADAEQGDRFYGTRGEMLYTIQNCAAATENMLLTATSLNLGSCWIGAFDETKVRTILQLPENIMPHAIVSVGYTDEKPLLPSKKKVETIVKLEKWAGRSKYPMKGYWSEAWPKIAENAQKTIKKHVKKLTK